MRGLKVGQGGEFGGVEQGHPVQDHGLDMVHVHVEAVLRAVVPFVPLPEPGKGVADLGRVVGIATSRVTVTRLPLMRKQYLTRASAFCTCSASPATAANSGEFTYRTTKSRNPSSAWDCSSTPARARPRRMSAKSTAKLSSASRRLRP